MLIASHIRYCEWLGGTQVDASTHEAGTSPSSFITASSARTICERARAEGFWFVRKMGDGTEASAQAVVLGSTRRDGYRTHYIIISLHRMLIASLIAGTAIEPISNLRPVIAASSSSSSPSSSSSL
jgi:hypothetical protein